jgi:hypothetical protein
MNAGRNAFKQVAALQIHFSSQILSNSFHVPVNLNFPLITTPTILARPKPHLHRVLLAPANNLILPQEEIETQSGIRKRRKKKKSLALRKQKLPRNQRIKNSIGSLPTVSQRPLIIASDWHLPVSITVKASPYFWPIQHTRNCILESSIEEYVQCTV